MARPFIHSSPRSHTFTKNPLSKKVTVKCVLRDQWQHMGSTAFSGLPSSRHMGPPPATSRSMTSMAGILFRAGSDLSIHNNCLFTPVPCPLSRFLNQDLFLWLPALSLHLSNHTAVFLSFSSYHLLHDSHCSLSFLNLFPSCL